MKAAKKIPWIRDEVASIDPAAIKAWDGATLKTKGNPVLIFSTPRGINPFYTWWKKVCKRDKKQSTKE